MGQLGWAYGKAGGEFVGYGWTRYCLLGDKQYYYQWAGGVYDTGQPGIGREFVAYGKTRYCLICEN